MKKLRPIIDRAINELKLKGIEPSIINLTDSDYEALVSECNLDMWIGKDYTDGEIKKLQFYNGVEIDCRLPDIAEVQNPLLTCSYIASSNIYQQLNLEQVQKGRIFNLESLKEIEI